MKLDSGYIIFSALAALWLLLTGIAASALAQRDASIEVYFQDFHSADVTHLITSPDENWAFTADQTGKILMWNINDFTVYRTIRDGLNYPVNSMQLNPAGNKLMVASGPYQPVHGYRQPIFNEYDSESDTTSLVLNYPVFKNEPPDTIFRSDTNFYGGSDDNYILLSIHQGQETGLFGFTKESDYNLAFGYNMHLFREGNLGQAAYHASQNLLALGFSVMGRQNRLGLYDADTFELLDSIDYENQTVIALRFDRQINQLYAVLFNPDERVLTARIYDTDSGLLNTRLSEDVPVQTEHWRSAKAEIHLGEKPQFIIHDNSYPGARTTILTLDQNKFKHMVVRSDYSLAPAAILDKTASRILFPSENGLGVYDLIGEAFLTRYQRKTAPPLRADYLPGNHIFVQSDYYRKFYESGSLVNRFSRTGFTRYLMFKHDFELNHNGGFISAPLDKHTGKMALYGEGKLAAGKQYYLYDVIHDELKLFSNHEYSYDHPLQYSHNNRVLLAGKFYNSNEFALITEDDLLPFTLTGNQNSLKLSQDGRYLFTWSTDVNKIYIRKTSDLSVVFEYTPEGIQWNQQIGNSGSQGFYAAFYDSYSGPGKTYIFEPQGDTFETSEVPFMVFDYTHLDDFYAVLGNIGIVALSDGRTLRLDYSTNPVSVSFNDTAEKLMVSFSNGTISIYNVETLEEIVRMVHPDEAAHIMFNRDGYFSANTDARQWLAVRSENGPLPFEQAAANHQPHKVLESLGQVSPEMRELLEQSTRIRMRNRVSPAEVSVPVSLPEVSNIRLNGQPLLSTTDEKLVEFTFDVYDEASTLTDVEILINGTPIRINNPVSSLPPGETHTISTTLELVNGENTIHLTLRNAGGGSSPRFERSVSFRTDEKPDLYLLAVGVSEYEDESYNLAFADKDAWDMAMLMSDFPENEFVNYLNRFYGHRYRNDSKSFESQTIRQFSDNLTERDRNEYMQVSPDGRLWLIFPSMFSEALPVQLWDFKTGEVTNINLPNVEENAALIYSRGRIIPYQSASSIAYTDSTGALNLYYQSTSEHIVFDTEPFEFEHIIRSGENEFIGQLTYGSRNENNLGNHLIHMEILDEKISFTPFEEELEWVDALRAVSPDGNKLLISSVRELYVLDRHDFSKSVTWDGFAERGWRDAVAFSDDSNMVYSLHRTSDPYNAPTQTWIKYRFDLQTQQTDSLVYTFPTGTFTGMNITGGKLNRINRGVPLSELTYSRQQLLAKYANEKASSFNQVYVKKLVNEEATGRAVTEAIETFFSHARPEDQIVLFIAGHGVLDDDYTYYFAASDFDFYQPSENGVAYEQLIRLMSDSPSTRRLLLMDTCHAGEVFEMEVAETGTSRFEDGTGRTFGISTQQSLVDRPADLITLLFDQAASNSGITVITASGGAEVAYETTELSNGAFTTAFMELVLDKAGLSQAFTFGTAGNTILNDEMMREIGSRVMRYTGGRQVPNIRERNRLGVISVW